MRFLLKALTFLGICGLGHPAAALELGSPVNCRLGETCFIQQYVDHGSGPSITDAFCGSQSYDNHKGTDFAVADRKTMQSGVRIVAAAKGVVVGTRDGMADGAFEAGKSVKGRECGNGVVVRHASGWTTQYCHLRLNSVAVRKGDLVNRGQALGLVGMSGQAEFPHLHFQVTRNKIVIDPFDSSKMKQSCSVDGAPLWAANSDVRYRAGGIMSAGIVDAPPTYDLVKQSSPTMQQLSRNSAAMVFWTHFFGLEKDDTLTLKLTGPDGTAVSKVHHRMTKNRAVEFRFGGRKRRGQAWAAGRYEGTAELRRNGKIIARRRVTTLVR